MKLSIVAAAALGLVPVLAGCSDAGEDDDSGESGLALKRASSESSFEKALDELEARFASADAAQGGSVRPQTLGPRAARLSLASRSLCTYLSSFRSLEHAYFYFGGTIGATGAGTGGQAGMDFVYDLYDRQAAVFGWEGRALSIGTAGYVAAGGYFGYGFGKKANVIDAWSGTFEQATLSIDVPETKLGVDGSTFRSPDGSIVGIALGGTAGLALSWPIPASGQLSSGFWTPFDAGTRALASWSYASRHTLQTAPAVAGRQLRNFAYVQYDRASDLALALLTTAPAGLSAVPAAETLAIGVLRDSGRTVDQLCPRR